MPYVLVGAGGLGRKVAAALRVRLLEVVAFADRDTDKQRTRVDGVLCLSIEEAVRRFPLATYVVTIWGAYSSHRIRATEAELVALGIRDIRSFGELLKSLGSSHYFIGGTVLPGDKPDIDKVGALWADASSSFEYSQQVAARLANDVTKCGAPVVDVPYIPGNVYRRSVREVVIDGGAYDGDTLAQWLAADGPTFVRWLAVEPHPVSASRFRDRVATMPEDIRRRVTLSECALGKESGRAWFARTASESSAAVPEGSIASHHRVDVSTVDSASYTNPPTLLKLDIEGAELDAIAGARKTIRAHRPVVAACVYHTPDHLWRVPLAIHALMPDAKFYLRPHMAEGWDTVCYAVPPERAL